MGQQQKAMVQVQGQAYPQVKPYQIGQLQKYLDEGNFAKVQSSPNYSNKGFQLLLRYKQSNHLVYGLKFTDKKFVNTESIDVKDLNGPVQIYLLQNQSKSILNCLCFEGELQKGKRNNFGVEYQGGKEFYQGMFKNNKYHGWGITSQYEGEWANGLKFGYGKFKSNFPKGDSRKNFTYEGNWKNDRFDGLGARNVLLAESNNFVSSTYVAHNPTEIDYQYIGEWLDGVMFGCGKIIKYNEKGNSTQRQIYEGEFVKNFYQGRGKLKLDDSDFKEGKFQAGKFVKAL